MPKLIKKLPDVKFVIVGDGPKRADLEEQSQALGIKNSVIFAGAKPWDEIGKSYQLGDVFVSASTSETQGLTYIEAMAASVAVVAKKDRSVEKVVIDGETGYYFDHNEEVADVLYKALTAPDKNQALRERALKNIAHLSSEVFGKSVEELYYDVLKNAPTKKARKLPKINIKKGILLGRFGK
jgi:1,2-diacylglycerol 3-alpha-glucosyltransferase